MKQTLWYNIGTDIIYLRNINNKNDHLLGFYLYNKADGDMGATLRILIPKTLYGVWWLTQRGYTSIKNKEEFLLSYRIKGFSDFGMTHEVRPIEEFPY